MASFLDDMISDGQSLWLKISAGAVATPVIVLAGLLRAGRRNEDLDPSELPLIAIGVGAVLVGAGLGALLAAKDVVAARSKSGKPVPIVLKLLLGYGAVSLLIWAVLAIFGTLAITLMVLGV